ncbi:DarT ssDNA thymidine ADP-ribosyltransferase family protein [Schumannella luteola]
MSECIHGIEGTMCDVCFPKEKPQPARRTAPVRAARATTSAPRAGATPARPAMLRTGELRVYHVTHVRNLPAILEDGALIAGAAPVVDVSSELTRELRATAEVTPGRPVADYVAFALAPDSTTWVQLRGGAAEPRWSAAARASAPADFVVLVSTIASLGAEVVIADGDAAGTYTRFAAGAEAERMLARLHSDPEARAGAEVLAPERVALAAIPLIGVAHEPARDDVRRLLAGSGFTPKVAVYPPWFAPE